jgi:hypothetical protein
MGRSLFEKERTEKMPYLVIETFGGLDQAIIVVHPDTGLNKVFDTIEEAQTEADDCQGPVIVEVCQ